MQIAWTMRYLLLLSLAAILAGCNTGGTQALDTARPEKAGTASTPEATAEATEEAAKEEAGAKIIRQPSTVTRKGNYIVALVNNQPITNYDVQRRVSFRKLRRLKPTRDEAIKELVDQEIKLQEAQRLNAKASNAQVDQAFANFARSNKSTPARIARDLDQIGVGAKHFKEFIRAQISWNRAVGNRLQSETRGKSQSEALFEIRKSGSEKPETTEYTLQQIIFVIPNAKRKQLLKTRKAEANAFAQRFPGCDSSIDMAKGLHDVTVKNIGRKLLPELPQEWSKEVQQTEIGKTAGPKETNIGIELLAVCAARVVADDRAAQVVTQSNAYDAIEEKGNAMADELLAELRKSAVIVYK